MSYYLSTLKTLIDDTAVIGFLKGQEELTMKYGNQLYDDAYIHYYVRKKGVHSWASADLDKTMFLV